MTICVAPNYVAGEIPAEIEVAFTQADGTTPIDITGFSAAWIYSRDGEPAVSRAAAVTDGPNGKATFTPVAADFADAGHYQAHLWVGNGAVRLASERFNYTVEPNLGTVPAI